MDDIETVALSIGLDDDADELVLPAALVDGLAESGQDRLDAVADVAVMAFTEHAHALAHHTEDGPDEELEAVEEWMLERFEERFGVTYAEATGHSH